MSINRIKNFITSVQEYIRADGVCSGCSLSFKVDILLIVYSWTRIDGTQGCCNPSSLGPCYLWRKDFQWIRVPGQDRRLLYSQCVIFSLNLAWPKKKCISKNINSKKWWSQVQCEELSGKSILQTALSHSQDQKCKIKAHTYCCKLGHIVDKTELWQEKMGVCSDSILYIR